MAASVSYRSSKYVAHDDATTSTSGISRKTRRRRKMTSVSSVVGPSSRRSAFLAVGLIAAAASAASIPSASAAAAAGLPNTLGSVHLPSVVPNLVARSSAAVRSASRGARSGILRSLARLPPPPTAAAGGSGDGDDRGGPPTRRRVAALASSAAAAATTTTTSERRKKTKRRSNNTGFYYGIKEDVMLVPYEERDDNDDADTSPKNSSAGAGDDDARPLLGPGQRLLAAAPNNPLRARSSERAALSDVMGETLLELREMREDIAALRDEMRVMKRRMRSAIDDDDDEYGDDGTTRSGEIPGSDRQRLLAHGEGGDGDGDDGYPHPHEQQGGLGSMIAKRRKAREFDRIGMAVEKWAERMLFDEGGEEDGWKEVACNKMVRKKFNKDGATTCYLKWMKDSRGSGGEPDVTGVSRGGGGEEKGAAGSDGVDPDRPYPCIKVYTTFDAPYETVCAYLADEARLSEYNDLVVANRDLEEISPHSKITWGQTPQILFVKPRDFVTYCHHRWKSDGTQVVVNQAVEHEDAPGCHTDDGDDDGKDGGRVCRAFALRGANFIQPDPDDPNKTRMAILSHASVGGGIPQWATKTAINAVVPIEPFKLFHNIEAGILKAMEDGTAKTVSTRNSMAEMAASKVPGRSSKPAGLSQLGYACFWPNGGGLKEGFLAPVEERHAHRDDMYPHEGPPPPSSQSQSYGQHRPEQRQQRPTPPSSRYDDGGRYDGRPPRDTPERNERERGEYYDPGVPQ